MIIGVFGANGMLGKYVSTYLTKAGHTVKNFNRADLDVAQFSEYEKLTELLNGLDAVVNCAGTIKPVANVQPKERTFMVNSVWPNYLARTTHNLGIRCIHITTDCVYTGKDGNYSELDSPDMFDDYGFSKSLGDAAGEYCRVFRTSIIGEELRNKHSLVEWAKSQKGKEVKGFTNHRWNGLTCLQLAKNIEEELVSPDYSLGIVHLYSNAVNKYELLEILSDVFQLDLKIEAFEAGTACDRTLTSTIRPVQFLTIREQVQQLIGYLEQ